MEFVVSLAREEGRGMGTGRTNIFLFSFQKESIHLQNCAQFFFLVVEAWQVLQVEMVR